MPKVHSECKVKHTALRQITAKIEKDIGAGRVTLPPANLFSNPPVTVGGEIVKLAGAIFCQALHSAKECGDPTGRAMFFKRAGVHEDTIEEILRSLSIQKQMEAA